uniref:PH domain-containing protein n=1 Tax=Glossina palpalis gambiensis TaxID=67801 RepID=A0A1B0BJR6_9MUSC
MAIVIMFVFSVSPPCLLIEDIRRDEKTIKDLANTITNLSQQQKTRWTTTAVNNVLNSHLHHHTKSTGTTQQQQQQQQQQHQQQPQHEENKSRDETDYYCRPTNDLSSNYLAKTVELRVNPPPPNTAAKSLPVDESLNAKKGWLMKQDNRTGDWTKHWFTLSGAALFYYRDPVSEERGVLDGVLDVNSLTNVAEVNANRSYAFQLTSWDKRRLTLASLSPNSRNSWIAILTNAAGLQNTINTGNNTSNNNIKSNNNGNSLTMHHSTAALENNNSSKALPTTKLIIKDNSNNNDIKSEIEKDFMKAQCVMQNYTESPLTSTNNAKKITADVSPQLIITNVIGNNPKCSLPSPNPPLTSRNNVHFSSDEEYRTASEGGRRDSIGDWGSPQSPSPPLPSSLAQRTKDRMRTRSTTPCHRMHKRSRSSPPTSRHSTMDSVGSDELPPISTVQEEIHLNLDKELQFRLNVVEKERDLLRNEAKERETRMSELLNTLERTEQELNNRIHEMEEVRENLNNQLDEAKRSAGEIIARLTDELEESQKKIKELDDRLSRGIEENENLYKRLREMETCSPASFINLQRTKMKRMDSLSDLTQIKDIDPYGLQRDNLAEEYNELKGRFEKAVNEIRAMKKELKESQNQYDSLEISYASLKQDLERKGLEDQAQLHMMAARIQDLTLKYSSSERQVRSLKQKLSKSERRRSLSLKGKEQLTVSKELEVKLGELENKIDELEKSHPADNKQMSFDKSSNSRHPSKKTSRRRSLESNVNSTPLASPESMQILVRVNDLEKRCDGISSSRSSSTTTTPISCTPTLDTTSRSSGVSGHVRLSEHLMDRLKCLESVLVASKDSLEQSLVQLQNLRCARTRRSVSPITERKDSYRFVERCLHEVVKLIRDTTETCVISGEKCEMLPNAFMLPDSSPVKLALTQLETQLRSKLADLLKQRRILRERNELTKRKDLELLAERIAFESVCFGKLRDSMQRAENPELFTERQTRAEVAETSHLMSMLKSKLQGKCTIKTSGSLDILAGVLARRLMLSTFHKTQTGQSAQDVKLSMEPVDQNILDDLLRQQNEINVIVKRYRNNAMENLATNLAAETLSYISTNDLVQGTVQEAWRQAQETVNAELVQSEIAHIMMRNAERLESSLIPSFGYTLTSEERLSFEKFADAVHDVLRREMELAVTQLSQCYEDAVQQMKRGQWRLHLQQERKTSEGRQLLSEFADVVAHKALVDARVDVLKGDYANQNTSKMENNESEGHKLGITALQKYEDLFEELSTDLQIDNPDDILMEADFEFTYKQRTVDFFNDRQVLCDISTFLSQLEDSLIALQCEATSGNDEQIPRTEISIESLQDVCHKCCELRKRADQLLQEVHRKLNATCQHCMQIREKLHSLQEQHQSEILRLQQSHAKDVSALMQQVEHQLTSLRCLETEKNAINGDLHKSEELIEKRERELTLMKQNLHDTEQQLHAHQSEHNCLLQRLREKEEKVRIYREENDALNLKCARQDDEYVILLQERDYLQNELAKEQERSRRFEKRLELLEREHSKEMECLQQAYRDQMLAHCSDFSNAIDEDSFHQRYQTEIDQLRTLCEKGLSAMESSHRRTISDLEGKHKQEIERLLTEKEQALAEETQATLAALDAMRKAHQSEVQREVARFKQEFLKQFQSKGERTPDTAKAKEEELEELRQEILSFSEKYSIKCVENAALEEKLRVANQKLKHFQQMQQLELRNKQFRAHLASENPSNDVQFLQGLSSAKTDGDEVSAQDSELSKHVHALKYTDILKGPPNNPIKTTTTTTITTVTKQFENCATKLQQSSKIARIAFNNDVDNNNQPSNCGHDDDDGDDDDDDNDDDNNDDNDNDNDNETDDVEKLKKRCEQDVKHEYVKLPQQQQQQQQQQQHQSQCHQQSSSLRSGVAPSSPLNRTCNANDRNDVKIPTKLNTTLTTMKKTPITTCTAINDPLGIAAKSAVEKPSSSHTIATLATTGSSCCMNTFTSSSSSSNTITTTTTSINCNNFGICIYNEASNSMPDNDIFNKNNDAVNDRNDDDHCRHQCAQHNNKTDNDDAVVNDVTSLSSCAIDDNLDNCQYTYEPCYKQTNLFNYHNCMLNTEGLNSSTTATRTRTTTTTTTPTPETTEQRFVTFGRNLKISVKSFNEEKNTNNTEIMNACNNNNKHSKRRLEEAAQKSVTTTTDNDEKRDKTPTTVERKYYMKMNELSEEKCLNEIELLRGTAEITKFIPSSSAITLSSSHTTTNVTSLITTTKPVDLPKNTNLINFNKNNRNNNNNNNLFYVNNYKSNSNNNHNNTEKNKVKNNNTIINIYEQQPKAQLSGDVMVKLPVIKSNNNNNNNNTDLSINQLLNDRNPIVMKTSRNLKIAERSAINLNSFTEILRKTAINAPIKGHNENVDNDIDNKQQPQQQQHEKHHHNNNISEKSNNNSNDRQLLKESEFFKNNNNESSSNIQSNLSAHLHNNNNNENNCKTFAVDVCTKTKRSRISSPPPLDGRDVELSINTNNPSFTSSTNNTNTNIITTITTTLDYTNSLKNPHMKRFELQL